MNIQPLVNDMAFKLIEAEYAKRIKKRGSSLGEKEYTLYLQALIERIYEVCGGGVQNQEASEPEIQDDSASVPASAEPVKRRRGRPPGSNRSATSIDDGNAPLSVQYKKQIAELLAGHTSSFRHKFPEEFPAGELNVWLAELGLPWEVARVQPPNSSLRRAANGGSVGAAAENMQGNEWTVDFGRK